ncbi:hypothetical protein E3O59_04870 [Cryobacterium sp. MDB2-33-2]|nr:hypothetical protein E3O59_04870 [Cryobacterium sp. MDB2-33-2]TFC14058.1 hypothetical protein E3O35_03635 [Cryobacterium sp. MDB2-A-2]
MTRSPGSSPGNSAAPSVMPDQGCFATFVTHAAFWGCHGGWSPSRRPSTPPPGSDSPPVAPKPSAKS